MYTFLHYVLFKNGSNSLLTNSNLNSPSHPFKQQNINTLIDELRFDNNSKSEFGTFSRIKCLNTNLEI